MKSIIHTTAFIASLALPLCAVAQGASTPAAEPHHTLVAADAVKWGPAPPSLPPGALAAVLYGDPGQAAPFVLRLKLPVGYTFPPHRHSQAEPVTVIAGTFAIGSGEKFDHASMKPLPTAGFVYLPAGMAHYARAETDAIVQINGVGPFDIIYVDPADDPRKQ